MAITKIHPIKSTLNLSIKYILNSDKTDKNILISTYMCNEKTAHNQFLNTRKLNNINGTVLARHLIQSFLPNEVTPEKAHEIGKSLCKEILKDQYEYVLSTHIDKNHIYNHIIFDNVNFVTGKCYQSNKGTYHKIRSISDKLCKENNLSVLDNPKEKGKSHHEYIHYKNGTSWKSKLKFSIDKAIEKSNTWEDFIKIMEKYGYEIKYGKYIAFKHKDKERFTRSKTLGEYYSEDFLKERIKNNKIKTVINLNNEKIKNNKGLTHWARKQNLKILSSTILEMRNQNIKSSNDILNLMKKNTQKLQDIQNEIKMIENKINHISKIIKAINTINLYHKNKNINKNNYTSALTFLKKHYTKMPNKEDVFKELEILEHKKSTLKEEYSKIKVNNYNLNKIKNNYQKSIHISKNERQ